jgi:polar amino acid transport system substrate-binding protein
MDCKYCQQLGLYHRVCSKTLWVIVAFTSAILFAAPGTARSGPVYNRITKNGMLRIGVPYNRVPLGFLKKTGQWVGFEVDLAREIAGHLNLKTEMVKVNRRTWKTMLSKGGIDVALCGIIHTRSLEREFDFSVPYFFDSPHVMVATGTYKSVADLKGKKVAAVQGSPSEKNAMNLLRKLGDPMAQKDVQSFPDRPTCFMELGRGKVAGWLDSGMVLLEYSSQSPGHFELIPVADGVREVAAALPQDDSAWRDLINFTLQDMTADGSFKKVYTKWFGPHTPYAFPLLRPIDTWPE